MAWQSNIAPRDVGLAQIEHRAVQRADDAALWATFAGAEHASDFCRSWLAIQCSMIPGAAGALLLLEEPDGRYKMAAVWPDPSRDYTYLAAAAQQSLMERRGLVHRPEPSEGRDGGAHVAYPVDVGGRMHGVVVVHVGLEARPDLQAILRQLLWGVGWLEALFRRRQADSDGAQLARTTFAMDVLAGASEQRAFHASALDVANELANRLNCRRVSIGLAKDNGIRLAVISHSAVFHEKAHVVATIENAMEEALDQSASIALPPVPASERRIALAHRDLARQSGANSVASVVMASAGRPVGVITLERDSVDAFDGRTVQLLEAVAVLLGPLLEMKADTQRLIAGKLADKTSSGLKALFGPRRPAVKLAAAAAVAALAFVALVPGEFRISAKAVVEGAVQRAAVAPFDGFIAAAQARAGDVVAEGQVLATLDDRELALEEVRWRSELEQQVLKYNDALGKHDRSAARVLAALVEQAKAQLALVEDKRARAKITAPFSGVVVSGDLSQLLGSPIEKGKMLFELAPLDKFRVILQVDERDVLYVKNAQTGQLVLTGFSSAAFPLKVKTVTPVATAADGRNYFRIEAQVDDPEKVLRPGMEGIGKVAVGERSLLWIWSRTLIDWLRITLWKWWP
jgi:multidrug efflux pump subunit AcrA (membrane-fusion protein)